METGVIEKRELKGEASDVPFASWEIWSQVLDDATMPALQYPEGDEGVARQETAQTWLDPVDKRILIRRHLGCTGQQVREIVDHLRVQRMSGTFPRLRMSYAELMLSDTPVLISGWGFDVNVIRCRQPGCDSFGDWHREDLSSLDKCETHVACDRSTDAFKCRLILKDGTWTPDYGPRAGMRNDPTNRLEDLAFALLDLASSSRRLNDEDLVI
jgi:hypothetical protein